MKRSEARAGGPRPLGERDEMSRGALDQLVEQGPREQKLEQFVEQVKTKSKIEVLV